MRRPHELPEYDMEFVEQHIRNTDRVAADQEVADGSEPEADATFAGLLGRLCAWFFPPTYRTDSTVRVEAVALHVRHVGSLLQLLRLSLAVGVNYLVVSALVIGWPNYARTIVTWYFVVSLCATVVEVLVPAGCRAAMLLSSLILLPWMLITAGPDRVDGVLKTFLLPVWVAWQVASLSLRTGAWFWLQLALIAFCCLYLVEHFEGNYATAGAKDGVSAAIFLSVNAFCTWIIAVSFQRWMLAGRGIELSEIRTYLDGSPMGRKHRTLLWSTRLLICGACLTSAAWTGAVVSFLNEFANVAGNSSIEAEALTRLGLRVCACHTGNWLFAELVYRRRLPRVSSWLRSWYVAWRGMTAWIAYVPVISAPAVFQFPRPWSSLELRMLMVVSCLVVNSAFVQSAAWDWLSAVPSESHVSATTSPTSLQRFAHIQQPLRVNLLSFHTGLAALVILSVLPCLILWLSLTAIWGPALTAAHDAHETLDSTVTPPSLI